MSLRTSVTVLLGELAFWMLKALVLMVFAGWLGFPIGYYQAFLAFPVWWLAKHSLTWQVVSLPWDED